MADPLTALATARGRFAMVALDQRESLRTMIAEDRGVPVASVPDGELRAFKLAAVETLAADASAVLIDRHYGFDDVVERNLLPADTGLILAADALVQEPGSAVQDTFLDQMVAAEDAKAAGAHALKLLVIWRRDGDRGRRLALARQFVAACEAAGVASVLEGVVRPVAGDGDVDHVEAVVEAARELGGTHPSLYKAEVPAHGRLADGELLAACRMLDAALDVPWVVLSQGVEADAFPRAVEIACLAGASGFLAGRGVWRDCVAAPDVPAALRERALPRLRALGGIVASGAPTR